MQVRFSQSARKHKIGKARALHVMNTVEPVSVAADEELEDRLLWVGVDDRGVELEIVGVVEADYLLVIHVMPRQFRRRNP